jgi:hypothetical protein
MRKKRLENPEYHETENQKNTKRICKRRTEDPDSAETTTTRLGLGWGIQIVILGLDLDHVFIQSMR